MPASAAIKSISMDIYENQPPQSGITNSPVVRTGRRGTYVVIHAHTFEQGVQAALEHRCPEIHLTGPTGTAQVIPDFNALECLGGQLTSVLFYGFSVIKEIDSFESIYSLQKLQQISFQEKQRFDIDLTRFPELRQVGAEYWKGIESVFSAIQLSSLVLTKYIGKDLTACSSLQALQILHVYQSKIETLKGIGFLRELTELSLSRDKALWSPEGINECTKLKKLRIEKCPKLTDLNILKLHPGLTDILVDGEAYPAKAS